MVCIDQSAAGRLSCFSRLGGPRRTATADYQHEVAEMQFSSKGNEFD